MGWRALRRRRSSDSGVALLIVVGTLAILSVIAADVIGVLRQDMLELRLETDRLAAEAAMEGAMWTIAHRLIEGRARPGHAAGAEGDAEVTIGGLIVLTHIRSERSKIDLNLWGEEQLAAVIQAAGAGVGEAAALAAAIVDWRDAGDELQAHETGGARYGASSGTGSPRSHPFADVTELQSVPGIPRQVYECLLPDLTVYASSTFDTSGASPLLLHAMAGSQLDRGDPDPGPLFVGDAIGIETRIQATDGTDRFTQQWIIRITDRRIRPIEVLERRDLGPLEAAADAACPPGLGPARP